jgi:hypothetical protein
LFFGYVNGHNAASWYAGAAAFALLLIGTSTRGLPVQMTGEAYVGRICSNGTDLRQADDLASEAYAVNDDDRFFLAQEAARQYWRCAHTTDDPMTHDLARLEYGYWYARSFATVNEFLLHAQEIYNIFDGVYLSTKNDQVRANALRLRQWFSDWMLKDKALAPSQ